MKMIDEVKTPWLDRLRSGTIPQMTGWLGNEAGERCCLGVLCDLAFEADVIDTRELVPADGVFRYGVYGSDGTGEDDDFEETDLPNAVRAWAFGTDWRQQFGDSRVDPLFIDHPEYGRIHVAVLNDGAALDTGGHKHSETGQPIEVPKHTFEQIAALVEEQW